LVLGFNEGSDLFYFAGFKEVNVPWVNAEGDVDKLGVVCSDF
jgi:hypothetical protein